MSSRTLWPLLGVVGLLVSGCVGGKAVSTATLLTEMTDLRGMAEFPNPPYTCKQFSSYDRASESPEQGEAWFANNDAGQFLRTEQHDGREEYVMMDADGPGAIVRIWSANPKGTLRVYLDHSETPVLEEPTADMLDGKVASIPAPIACECSRGHNCYLPIPYVKHCKVTCDEAGFYYHVNYRTYPRWTELTSFKLEDLTELAPQIEQIAERLAKPRESDVEPIPWLAGGAAIAVNAGESVWPVEIGGSGSGALTGLRVKVDGHDVTQSLRNVLLLIEFDGEQTVVCPLGDFFGAGPGVNAYASLPLGVTADGEMWSHWVMPFRRSARVGLQNLGSESVRVKLGVATGECEWTRRSMHFCARWRVEHDFSTRPMLDWNYAQIAGKGVFAGAAFAITNPVKAWWGEGDEKIYVDGETFPSHFGTGTEDYYGYAWCYNVPFTHAYHAQPRCDGPGNYGHTAVNRWHIIDRIPFKRDFRFDMELWHWRECRLPAMSVVTYWYARPGASSNRAAIDPADLPVPVVPPYVAPRVDGALEGEELRIVAKTGNPTPQGIDGCSNEQHLWWRGAQPGDKLVLEFPAPESGTFRVYGRFVKSYDYAIAQLSINGQKAGEPLDLYCNRIALTDEIPLGEFKLRAAANQLTAEIVGINELSRKEYMFGLDYIRLEPAR